MAHPVRVELQRMHLHAQRRDVLLLELASQVPLDEGGLPNTTIAHEPELQRAGKSEGAGLVRSRLGAGHGTRLPGRRFVKRHLTLNVGFCAIAEKGGETGLGRRSFGGGGANDPRLSPQGGSVRQKKYS